MMMSKSVVTLKIQKTQKRTVTLAQIILKPHVLKPHVGANTLAAEENQQGQFKIASAPPSTQTMSVASVTPGLTQGAEIQEDAAEMNPQTNRLYNRPITQDSQMAKRQLTEKCISILAAKTVNADFVIFN